MAVIALISMISNLAFTQAENLIVWNSHEGSNNEGKRSLLSLVQHVTKHEKDDKLMSEKPADSGSGSTWSWSIPYYSQSRYFFNDVTNNQYAPDIQALYDLEIVRGCTSDEFCPQNIVKRYEFIIMIDRLLQKVQNVSFDAITLPFDQTAYQDVLPTDSFAISVYRLRSLWLLDSLETKDSGIYYLQPDQNITLSEMMNVIHKILNKTWWPSPTKDISVRKDQTAFILTQAFGIQARGLRSQQESEKTLQLSPEPIVAIHNVAPASSWRTSSQSFTDWLMASLQSWLG